MKRFCRFVSLFLMICSLLSACAVRRVDGEDTPPDKETVTETECNNVTESETEAETAHPETSPATKPPTEPVTQAPQTEPPVTSPPDATQPPVTNPPSAEPPAVSQPASGDCLFIGDSRTVGLQLYSGLDADFFANVGMSVNSIGSTSVEVADFGKVTLESLMAKKQYKRIFIMLGINEIGSSISSILPKYKSLVENIKQKQPDAAVFIEANLHVTNTFTEARPSINNTSLNNYNAELAKLADNQRVFYLDANFMFDDATGQLSPDKTSDGVHYYPKEYTPWAQWLLSKSAELLG